MILKKMYNNIQNTRPIFCGDEALPIIGFEFVLDIQTYAHTCVYNSIAFLLDIFYFIPCEFMLK